VLPSAAFDDDSRVDVQIFNAKEIFIPTLQPGDFALQVDGKPQPVKSFVADTAPLDVLFLLDVNVAMKPNVHQLVDAAEDAMRALTPHDRVGILVFDVNVRPRLPFTSDREEIMQQLNSVVHTEHFVGTARITSSLISAASYLQRHARPDARRALVLLTDNATQDSEDEARVEQALQRAGATLSFLFADHKPRLDEDGDPIPEKRDKHRRRQEGDPPEVHHAAPLSPMHSAGAEKIAQDSGGDAVEFEDEYVLEDTLLHLRQRYSVSFDALDTKTATHEISVNLSDEARARFPDAVIHFRLLFTPGGGREEILTPITESAAPSESTKRRRSAVNEDASGTAAQKADPKQQ
jgi:VWFA-related protein